MTQLVPTWPRLSAILRSDATGELTINGTSHPIAAESIEWLRGGVIARAAQLARPLKRPVRLAVEDGEQAYQLAIHPDAYVEELSAEGTIEDARADAPHVVAEGRCWRCRQMQSLANQFCIFCGSPNPHEVRVRRPNDGGAVDD